MSDVKLKELQAILPDVSRETFERLLAFETLFLKWSKAFNLAAPSTHCELWERHILDSAQLVAIRRPQGTWLDIGSGGGLPGVIMAIFMAETPDGHVHLVESNGKKAAFLRTALTETGASGTIHNIRIEDASSVVGQANVVTARALAALPKLFELSEHWLSNGATALFHKGREYRSEIKVARDEWDFDLLEHASAIDRQSVILEIRSLQRKTR
ncbi:MAG: 16S rRNA (guanine(527)-N(7))-methyltransferase RsmG [Rhizobiaceae bacterium]